MISTLSIINLDNRLLHHMNMYLNYFSEIKYDFITQLNLKEKKKALESHVLISAFHKIVKKCFLMYFNT